MMIAGNALAQAMMQRKMKKQQEQRMMALAELLAGPEMQAQQIPGYQQDMSLVNSLVPQAPLKPLSPMDPSKEAPMGYNLPEAQGAVSGQYEQVAGQHNQQRELMKALLMSGNPQAEQAALSMAMPQSELKGANRFMNLGEGLVFDMADKSVMDFSGKKPKDLKALNPGQVLVDDEGNKIYEVPKDEKRQSWQTEIGVGNGLKQKAVFYEPTPDEPEGRTVPIGDPYSAVQRVEQTNYDAPPFAQDTVFKREMESQIRSDMEAAQRGKDILAMYRPEYQTVWGKAAATGAGWLDRVIPLKGEAKDELQRFAVFQRKVNENVNLYIKMITGAQMSEAEADRLSLAIANLTDSPAEFEAKLQDSISVLDRAQKVKQETLEYYAGVKGMDYEKAREYAEAAATREVQTGMAGIGIDWGEDSAAAKEYKSRGGKLDFGSGGGKEDKPPFDVPPGWTARKEGGTWKLKKE
jgi:hypothetical protein